MNLCFKAYATTINDNDEIFYRDNLVWIHPQEVNDDDLKDFMRDVFEIAKDESSATLTPYDWITVVAYDMDDNAVVACDYQRSHVNSEDYWYGDEISESIAKR